MQEYTGENIKKFPNPPAYRYNMIWKNSLIYSASPFRFGGGFAYVMEWENPRPDIAIDRVFAVNGAKSGEGSALLFCAAAVL